MTGNPSPVVLRVHGVMTAPTFHASVAELDYAAAPVGFVSTRAFTLHNTSPVPFSYVRVSGVFFFFFFFFFFWFLVGFFSV